MTKPMKYRDLVAKLRRGGCTAKPGKGDHEKWYCSCGGGHMTVITKTRDVSPGVVRQAEQRLTCLPKGWMH